MRASEVGRRTESEEGAHLVVEVAGGAEESYAKGVFEAPARGKGRGLLRAPSCNKRTVLPFISRYRVR